MTASADRCPVCGGEVADARAVMHYSTFAGGGGRVLRGRCSACDTALGRHQPGRDPGAWVAAVPAAGELLSVVSDGELAAAGRQFEADPSDADDWRELLGWRRPGDVVWRFAGRDRSGYAVVRGGRAVAQFVERVPPRDP